MGLNPWRNKAKKLRQKAEDIQKTTQKTLEQTTVEIVEGARQNLITNGSVPPNAKHDDWGKLFPTNTGALYDSVAGTVQQTGPYEFTAEIKADAKTAAGVEYGKYVEYGTGDKGTHTGPAWYFYTSDGVLHKMSGSRPNPFFRPAVDAGIETLKQNLTKGVKIRG